MRGEARRTLIALMIVYVVAVHAALLVMVMRTGLWDFLLARASLSTDRYQSLNRRAFRLAHTIFDGIDLKLKEGPVVLLGDSFVEAMPSDAIGLRVLNLGIGGITARELAGVVGRYPSLGKASAIVMTIGTNDLCLEDVDANEMTRRLESLEARLPLDVPVLWHAIPPVGAGPHAKCGVSPQRIREANTSIARACASRSRCRYAHGLSGLADPDGFLAKQYDAGDGVHLNAAAYALWGRQLAVELTTILRPAPGR